MSVIQIFIKILSINGSLPFQDLFSAEEHSKEEIQFVPELVERKKLLLKILKKLVIF